MERVSTSRVLLISLATLVWLLTIMFAPMAAGWVARALDLGTLAGLLASAGTFLALLFGTVVAVFVGMSWSARRAVDFVRTNGVRCVAYVKRYDRLGRSMTQQKVLFLIELPTGPIGRDYVMTGLDPRWLADVCALNKPIRVIAHPDASTLIIE